MSTKNVAFALLAAGLLFGAAAGNRGGHQGGLQPLPEEPALEPFELVDAQPFVLDEPFEHTWRAEAPQYRAGWLLVLRADPEFLRPRQTFEPVLYVGDQTAERLNAAESGHLVCLVPSPLDANGRLVLDPTTAPIWFGTPELPERVDAARIARERDLALAAGVGPAHRSGALLSSGAQATLYMPSRDELDLVVADWIEKYSPREVRLVEGLRVPLTR